MQPIKAVSSLLVKKVMRRMRITFCGLWLVLLCLACSPSYDHKGKTPLVEVDGRFLYQEDLQAVLPAGLSADDSLLFADNYVRTMPRWIVWWPITASRSSCTSTSKR